MPSPASSTSDVPLGTFEEQVMLAVVRTGRAPDEGGAYGMAVRRELELVAGREVAIGAVYATLDRLEAKGLVASERGEAGAGSSRRVFTLTPRGARALVDSREMRERLWRGVDLVPLLAGASTGRSS
ncbi:PadR family transcriptional regulator [Pyxidicoccus trucidator]|uniref:PadR family transcriptional regulator n=1 Tax=Pyxidicoccus trucidator TaxID=2709662 RepID=UPI00196733E1|nr:helix-turn-helix transcriptional regulator [Pyxidicoccus trucidator]